MNLHRLGIAILVCSVCACSESDSTQPCSYADPLEDLEWLSQYASESENCSCQITLFQGTYRKVLKRETVFFKLINDPRCNVVFGTVLYNCEGKVVKTYGANEYDTFSSQVTIDKTLSVCME